MLRRTKRKSYKVLCLLIVMLLLGGAIPIQVSAKSNDECIVVFDPDDGKTQYQDFYKTTVRKGDKVTDIPEDPQREGYFFKGWYAYLDDDNPVHWDFEKDVAEENTTLWADWEEGCIVAFDPDDGETQYQDFYKTTVRKGDKVTDIPEDPQREGYSFKGWYAYLDGDNPVYWDFEKDVAEENTTLWADWDVYNITKSSNVDEISVGKIYTYTITVTCSLFADIWENVLAKDVLADELDYVGFESEDEVVITANGKELYIDFGDINKGASKTVTITVKVNNKGKTGQVIENKVVTNDDRIAIDPNGPEIKEKDKNNPDIEEEIVPVPDIEIPLGIEKDAHIAYIQGYPEGDFRQGNSITRAEAAQIFYNLLIGIDKTGYSSIFSDVGYNSWYSDAINCLSGNNIILGYSDGTFRPDKYITRAEFATLASKFDELSLADTNQFKDVLNNHWAIKYINSAAIKGWVRGYENGEFRPDNNITRAETVSLVNSILQRKINLEDIPKDAKKYSDLFSSHWAYCDIIEASNTHSYERKEEGLSEIWITLIK